MNDNEPLAWPEDEMPFDIRVAQNDQLTKGRPLAERAIADASLLTTAEVQEMGWALFVALRRLREHESEAAWNADGHASLA